MRVRGYARVTVKQQHRGFKNCAYFKSEKNKYRRNEEHSVYFIEGFFSPGGLCN